jgi:hypothetical protein
MSAPRSVGSAEKRPPACRIQVTASAMLAVWMQKCVIPGSFTGLSKCRLGRACELEHLHDHVRARATGRISGYHGKLQHRTASRIVPKLEARNFFKSKCGFIKSGGTSEAMYRNTNMMNAKDHCSSVFGEQS